jgi:catechol 2,3-dioxygenase-like lactoylglutathione lyase family enzyme
MTLKLCLSGLFCVALACAQPAHQTGIAHVAFRVADLEASRAFYGKLGFEQFFEMKQGERTTEAFLKINDRQFIELYPQTSASQTIGLMHVCYESDDLEALHAGYVRRGLAVSDVRQAGAGNLLMTMKDPEGETIEYTQYMPGSRHFEDRGRHLGPRRVAQSLVGATATARDASAVREFYIGKLGFTAIGSSALRMPGESGQELDIVAAGPTIRSGMQFGVDDWKLLTATLSALGLQFNSTGAAAKITDPDGAAISFVKVGAK